GYLDTIKENVIISDETTHVDIGTLTAGDANNDNKINAADLDILREEYTVQQQNLLSDFNNDGIVDLIDLTILGINYNKTGPTNQPSD
ncbi:MAG: dockerin type I domain-containing protein, partial [Clostridia bacterium]